MNISQYRDAIIITKDSSKKSLIKMLKKENNLTPYKIITLSELKKKYYFDYTQEAVYYVSKKYNIISEIAKIYIENLYYIKNIDGEKIRFLNELKEDLENHNLLIKNALFKKFLQNKMIILYGLKYVDLFYQNIFEELKKDNRVILIDDNREKSKKKIYKANNKEDEIAFVASSIVKLIKSGININKIKLANVSDDYHFVIYKIFKEFNIPINLPSRSSVNGTKIVKKFKELYSNDMKKVFEDLKTFVEDRQDEELYQGLIKLVNEYTWHSNFEDIKELIFNDIEGMMLKETMLRNAINIINFVDEVIEDDEYVFLINFNQGVIPTNAKDEDYLSDTIKQKLNISTSVDINKRRVEEVQDKIARTKNMIVTYSAHDLTNELYISNAYDDALFIEEEMSKDYTNSDAYNKRVLLSAKDEYKKFGTITKELMLLNEHYKDSEYCSYVNSYQQLDKAKLREYLNNKLTLAYTSMNTYYQCGFRYYLEYILKVDKYEDSFDTIVGNIFHNILKECFEDNFDFEKSWDANISSQTYEFNNMERFFINNLKFELALVIDVIKNQMDYCSLKNALYEKEVIVPIDKNLNIIFKGYIDKVLYENFGENTIVAIIDYKTGNPDLNITNSVYGLDMQLPVYIYLLKNDSELGSIKIGGFYLQKILNNITDKNKKIDSLKWTGYSNSDVSILEKVDSSFNDSKIIRSMKTTSTGFSSYAKTITDREIDILYNIVDKKIKEASHEILDANFKINPKEIGGVLEGCKFCKFKDICYLNNKDIVKYKVIKKDELFGGDNIA